MVGGREDSRPVVATGLSYLVSLVFGHAKATVSVDIRSVGCGYRPCFCVPVTYLGYGGNILYWMATTQVGKASTFRAVGSCAKG
jgi:hypothetical protein